MEVFGRKEKAYYGLRKPLISEPSFAGERGPPISNYRERMINLGNTELIRQQLNEMIYRPLKGEEVLRYGIEHKFFPPEAKNNPERKKRHETYRAFAFELMQNKLYADKARGRKPSEIPPYGPAYVYAYGQRGFGETPRSPVKGKIETQSTTPEIVHRINTRRAELKGIELTPYVTLQEGYRPLSASTKVLRELKDYPNMMN